MASQEKKSIPITKEYLKTKLKGSTITFLILIGFVGGTGLGNLIFRESTDDIIQLTFIYSSEKSTWIGETLTEFQDYWESLRAENSSLKPISLDFQPYGSGSSVIALLNSEVKPVIWSPASNLWVPLLNAKWQDVMDTDDVLVNDYDRIIYSPVVMATWEEFNETEDIRGINDLHDYIVENPSEVKLAHTDPRSSNSGFMATIMMVGAKLQMEPDEITLDDISNPEVVDWMEEVESAAVYYGKSTGFLGRYMRDNGPDALTVAFLYENVVQDYCLAAEENHGQKMVAIYPEEGALFSDHPFCILDADWVTDEQRMVAEMYLEFIGQKDLVKLAISTGFRPINNSLLEDPEVAEIYLNAFNSTYGVTSDPSQIYELLPPTDGNIIARIPDLWLMTRNTI